MLSETAASKAGMEYEVANGAGLPHVGEKTCVMMTEDSALLKRITLQCADVHKKPLVSVSRVVDLGYECVLGRDGGMFTDTMTGDVIPLHRRGNLYFLKAWAKPDDAGTAAGFTRPEVTR